MLELPNFGQWPHTQNNLSHAIKFFFVDVMDRNYDAIAFISKYLYFRVANFADIKIATMFIETTFKDSKKLKELEIIY